MLNKIIIRNAGINDIPVIYSLAHQIWPKTYAEILSAKQLEYMLTMMYSTESLQYQIEKQQHTFIIIYQDDKPIGFAAYFQKYKNSPALYKLDKIYVLPDLQEKGIGNKLLEFIISDTKLKGASVLELNVNRKNKAISFYEKSGFTIIKEVDVAIGEGYFMNDYVMQKTIAG